MHDPIHEQGLWLAKVLDGHYNYYWERLYRLTDRWLPEPRIVHPWPEQRFDVRTQGRSPVR
ncbi:MAG: hypothetical protein ACLP0J_23810 [Solirubrobacteraceae bacterium]